ncbi:hypothetical protein [Paraclostridium bifermentans]|uniref:hypothetical protein n=1 Tax=Paraclostridium bifermentans TaxID=1490 RepID=UPI00359C2A39
MDKRIRGVFLVLTLCVILLSKIDNISLHKSQKFNVNSNIRTSLVREIQKDTRYRWSRYDSSKWVDSYKILNIKKLDYKTYDISVEFLLNDTIGKKYKINDTFIVNIK